MLSKIDTTKIIRDHIATLRDDATGKGMLSDYVLFFGTPLIPAIVLTFPIRLVLDLGAITVLVTSLSIFAALLFNLLLLIYDVVTKEERQIEDAPHSKAEFLRQIYSNVSFSILVSIMAVIVLLLSYFVSLESNFRLFLNAAAIYLLALFLLTLLMVLKRVHILLSKEF